jgi:hypothetical protein
MDERLKGYLTGRWNECDMVCPLITETFQDAISITTAGLTKIHETEPTKIAETTTACNVIYTTEDSTTTEDELPAPTQIASSGDLLFKLFSTTITIKQTLLTPPHNPCT